MKDVLRAMASGLAMWGTVIVIVLGCTALAVGLATLMRAA